MRASNIAISTIAALLLAGWAGAEATRTLELKLQGDPGRPFAVENLAGTMTITAGDGDGVVAVAKVHAETDELAAAMRFEQVTGTNARPTMRVVYPLDRVARVAYPDGNASSTVEYDTRRVKVTRDRGTVLWADVEVRVPRRAISGTFINHVGELKADGLDGTLRFDGAAGGISVGACSGDVTADTGSGGVKAEAIRGRFTCDTGSGGCDVVRFDGEELVCDTGSGGVRIVDAKARRMKLDTGSGGIRATAVDVEEFAGDTGSGGIVLEVVGARLRRVTADTGSGGVTLRLPPDAAFDLGATMGSGELECLFTDARPVVRDRHVVGYTRGAATIAITVDTGSGGVTVAPLR